MKKINPDSIYPIKAIVELDVLPKSNAPQSNWEVLLRHIRQGRAKAQNVGSADMPRYVMIGSDLIAYLQGRNLYPKEAEKPTQKAQNRVPRGVTKKDR